MPGTTFDVDIFAAGEGRPIACRDGQRIFAKGDRGDCAYIVKRGRVAISDGGRIIELIRDGEIFGEMALIDDGPRSSGAVAVGETELVPIDRSIFDALLRDDLDFTLAIMRLMARRLRAALGSLSPPEATAALGGRG